VSDGGPLPAGGRLRAVIEALVFAAEEPLTVADLEELFPAAPREALQAGLDEVARACEAPERGLLVIRVAGGFRMITKPEHGEWVRAMFRARNRRRLSPAALETLAIVAYRQPITTPEIQALRGADPTGVLEGLLDKRLVRVLGRKKVVGKPILYGTTPEFLTHFGLNSLDELPTPEEFGGPRPAPGPAESRAAAAGPFEEGDGGGAGDDEDEGEDDDGRDGSEGEDDGDDS
jgi:segregation and condensation protein B